MNCVVSLLFVLLPALTYGSFRIIGGFTAEIGDVPYQVGVHNLEEKSRCGGSIISQTVVLTAAQCLKNVNCKGQVKIVAGTNNFNDDDNSYNVSKIVRHPEFNARTLANDIAVIHIDDIFIYSAVIQRISLPAEDEVVKSRTPGVVAGWGSTSYPQTSNSNLLKYVLLTVLPQETCDELVASRSIPNGTYFCAKGGNNYKNSACKGDSGGAFATSGPKGGVVEGIVSWVGACGTQKKPLVLTLVSHYLEFIEENA